MPTPNWHRTIYNKIVFVAFFQKKIDTMSKYVEYALVRVERNQIGNGRLV